MNIFFSYPHDVNAPFVERLKLDLEARGHTVWFDKAEIKTGNDWRNQITRGILGSEAVVAFLSKHSVRDPGVCLNEIAIALAEKSDEAMVTVLVEPEKEVCAPVTITHIQWLKMDTHNTQSDDPEWYATHLNELIGVIEKPGSSTRNAELEQLRLVLNPLSFNADISYQLQNFTGREWLINRYEDWLDAPSSAKASKVFRIEGGPGMGKTAFTSYLAHYTKSSVLALHLCKSGSGATHQPYRLVTSLAYQMATRLPDYRARLLRVPCIQNPTLMQGQDAGSLWDTLISEPMAGAGKAGLIDRQRLAIVIDGLDEATKNGKNDIVELLVDHIQTLPAWIGVVLTGRPDPELLQSLKQYAPQVISENDPANQDDLRHYIEAWLKDEVTEKQLPAHKVQDATQALLKKSDGAILYLAQVREEWRHGIENGCNAIDLSNPSTLPSGLNALYLKSFKRRFPELAADPDNPTSRWNALVKPLLSYVLASPEPLPLDLARELMGWADESAGADKQHKALQAMGSLLKRTGDAEKPDTCTLALFHNSVREWLISEDSQSFRVFASSSLYPLAQATWARYLRNLEKDAFAWHVLPELFTSLSEEKQDALFGEPNLDTSQTLYRLADSMEPELRYTEAAASWRIQVRLSERLSRSSPESAQFADDLSDSFNRLGDALASLGKTDEALCFYQGGLKIRQELACAPENTVFVRGLWVSIIKVGDTLASLGRTHEALGYHQLGQKIAEELNACLPENDWSAVDLSVSFNRLGNTLVSLGKTDEALGYYQRCLKIQEEICARAPEKTSFACNLSASFAKLGNTLASLGRTDEALGYFQRGLTIAEGLSTPAPENARFARQLAASFNNLGNALASLGKTNEALGYRQRCLKIAEELSARAPENAEFARELSISFSRLGDTLASLGKTDEALGYYQQCLKIREKISARAPENTLFACDLGDSFNALGNTLANLGKTDEALGYFQRRLKIAEELSALAPENAEFARDLWISYWSLSNTTAGEDQAAWLRKLLSALTSMQSRGILAPSDEEVLGFVKDKLGIE
jgi:tetratricopeptide (TPR) repeat protein